MLLYSCPYSMQLPRMLVKKLTSPLLHHILNPRQRCQDGIPDLVVLWTAVTVSVEAPFASYHLDQLRWTE